MNTIIHMISGPRNISTAMMYAFDNRQDCRGIDEPFYACYLSRFPEIDHPGRAQIISSQPTHEVAVWESIEQSKEGHGELFIKNMAHHIHDLDLSRLEDHKCFVLVRDPKKILASFSKVVGRVNASDIGIIQEWKIVQYLKSRGIACPVVDTDQFLQNPKAQLIKLCKSLSIPFEQAMLSWTSGPREIDGCWAKYWYDSVHQSTGFAPHQEKDIILSTDLEMIYQEVLHYYHMLKNEATH